MMFLTIGLRAPICQFKRKIKKRFGFYSNRGTFILNIITAQSCLKGVKGKLERGRSKHDQCAREHYDYT